MAKWKQTTPEPLQAGARIKVYDGVREGYVIILDERGACRPEQRVFHIEFVPPDQGNPYGEIATVIDDAPTFDW